MSKIMAIANQKGGVGKTTTVVNLGAGLAEAGKKVLMIDLDPQASLTISMGFREPDKLDGTITDIFMKVVNDEVIPEGYAIHSVAERLDLIPSSIDLSAAEVSLVNAMRNAHGKCTGLCRKCSDPGTAGISAGSRSAAADPDDLYGEAAPQQCAYD